MHTDIGCSGYKIDIGIVDTENTSNYQLGIICDGKNYKRTKTARDREIVQNNVLKALGWDIYRIWTMDWWEKPDEVMTAIQEAIARKKSSKVNAQTTTTTGIDSDPMTAEKESVNKESTDKEKITKEEPIKEESIEEAVPTAQRDNNEISFVLKASPATSEKQTASASSAQDGIQQKYRSAKITPGSYSPEDFFL